MPYSSGISVNTTVGVVSVINRNTWRMGDMNNAIRPTAYPL